MQKRNFKKPVNPPEAACAEKEAYPHAHGSGSGMQCHNHPCGLPLPRFMPATSRTGEKDNCVDILQNGSLARSSGMQIGEKVGLTISTCMLWTKREHIAGIKSSTGLLIWREDDAVHLTSAAYGDLAAVLSGHRQTLTIRSAEPPGGGLQVLCRQGSDSFANLSG